MSGNNNSNLIVHGMKRSGNHAIINWIMSGGNFYFINNVAPVARELENSGSYTFPVNTDDLMRKHSFRKVVRTGLKPASTIFSFEDWPISEKLLDRQASFKNILILRNAENLFASRIKKAFQVDHIPYPNRYNNVMKRSISIWEEHAAEFLSDTTFLNNCTCIYFDRWLTDNNYRRKLANSLGITNSNIPDTRSKEGGYSSFDGNQKLSEDGRNELLTRARNLSLTEKRLLEEVLLNSNVKNLVQRINNHIR